MSNAEIQDGSSKRNRRENIEQQFEAFKYREDVIVLSEGTGTLLIGKKKHYLDTPDRLTLQEFLDGLVKDEVLTHTTRQENYHKQYGYDSVKGDRSVTVYRYLDNNDVVAMVREDNYHRSDFDMNWHDSEIAMRDDLLIGKRIKASRIVGNLKLPARRPKKKWWD